jgi:hypothetical protein
VPETEVAAAEPRASANTWSVGPKQTSRLPEHVSLDTWRQLDVMTQAELLERYNALLTALRYIAQCAPTIAVARRVATAALEGRSDYPAIDETENTVTEEQQVAAVEAKSQPVTQPDQPLAATVTDREISAAHAGGSPTNVDKLVEIVSAAGDGGISRAALHQKHRMYGNEVDAAIGLGRLTDDGNVIRAC